jgi:hypothetical protein
VSPTCTNIAAPIACPASNESYYDNAYIECGINYAAGNIAGTGATTATMELCIASCLNTASCVGGNWLPGPKNCYLKSTIGTKSSNAGVDGFYFTPGLVCAAAGAASSSSAFTFISVPDTALSQGFTSSFVPSSSQAASSSAVQSLSEQVSLFILL